MDKLTHYRTIIKRCLGELAALIMRQPTPGVESLCVFDEERDQYLLLATGWREHKRVRGVTLFVRLRNGKIWVEEDWTEDGITSELLKAGVPKEDIVLAFQSPAMRRLTEFAVA